MEFSFKGDFMKTEKQDIMINQIDNYINKNNRNTHNSI
jgi:hypothetical protein